MEIYYGETDCQAIYQSGKKQGQKCTNHAYYLDQKKYLCGVHSNKTTRITLQKNPNKNVEQNKLLYEREKIVESAAEYNRQNGIQGHVICSKLGMMKQPDHYDGYLKVFPNFKHQNRKDGFGCMSLSPKSLGPVNHIMSNLPIAKSIENYHQGAKIFNGEVDGNNQIKKESLEIRKEIYQDKIPYRHKFDHPQAKKMIIPDMNNKNIPLFSVYYDKNGNERRYNYIECRYFYCHYYELLVQQQPDFLLLKKKIKDGYNLQIIGYDGFMVGKDLMKHYLDTSRPFGHELVLYTMLRSDDNKEYPWNQYYQKHDDIYKDMF